MKLYEDIRQRTGGNVYIGVTGPVRTGKSTFVKRAMETLVLPNIENEYTRERARDELPQSGSGKTIMTAEPKFVPEEAVEISPDGKAKLSVRFIDSVGYMVPGAVGAEEDGAVRMVTTPWFDHEIPFPEAAELGTKKVMEQHCTAGVVVTTDGSVTELSREDYLAAERRAITDMQKAGKPFLVLLNTEAPEDAPAKSLAEQIAERYAVRCLPVNCLTLTRNGLNGILTALLYEFGVEELQFRFPGWLEALEPAHEIKTALYAEILSAAERMQKAAQAEEAVLPIAALPQVRECTVTDVDLGTGTVCCRLELPDALFYEVLSERSGVDMENDTDLLQTLSRYRALRGEHDRFSPALEQVNSTGYGIVMPSMEELKLEAPELVKKGGAYGVRLRASAPSIHLLRTEIHTELSPMVGSEQQTEELAARLKDAYEGDATALWDSSLFGKSLFELVSDGLHAKIVQMPEDSRYKIRDALERIVNEGGNGLICLIL